MKSDRAPNHGIGAPQVVRNLLIVAVLGVISLITLLLGVWSKQDLIAVIAWPLIWAGLSSGAMGLWMIYDSKIGKVREREAFLNKIAWRGDERVLDVGCGLGLFLIGAAKRLSTGRAVGIDQWQQEDLRGNKAAGVLNNAMIEGVADKFEMHTGDARKLPFDDASFNVVLSSMALHNIDNAEERQTAVREIARVLKAPRTCADRGRAPHQAKRRHPARCRPGCAVRPGSRFILADRDHVWIDSNRLRDRQQGGAGLDGLRVRGTYLSARL